MICKNCGKEFDGKYCPECGMLIGQQYTACPNCGKERKDREKFCSDCGYNFLSGNKAVGKIKTKINFAKLYNYLIAVGTVLMGIVAVLCLLSPIAVVDGLLGKESLQSGFDAIKGGELFEFDKIVSQVCIGILVVSVICIAYGFAKIMLANKKNNVIRDSIFWAIDSCIVILYVIFGSVLLAYINTQSSDLMEVQLGNGFSLLIAIGVIAFISLWGRIIYEITNIKKNLLKKSNNRLKTKHYTIVKDAQNREVINLLDEKKVLKKEMFYQNKSLSRVVVPYGVESIGDRAFAFCSSMTEIYIPSSVSQMGDMVFDGCGKVTIYCVADCKPDGWSSTWNICNYPVVWGYKGDK